MTSTDDNFGIVLVLIFVALLFAVLFLISKRKSKGFLGNRFLLYGAVVVLIIFFVAARTQLTACYQQIFKQSPYNFSDFKSIVFQYGEGDSLVNKYNSATGEYEYLDRSDKLQKKQLYMNYSDLLFLHQKAAEVGFWDFPAKELNNDTAGTNGIKPTVYLVEFNYNNASKKVLFGADFNGPPRLVEANRELISAIETVLSGAEDRQKK